MLDSEPGRRSGGFSLGPRVLVDRQALVEAGLLGFGSRANYQVMLRVDEAKVAALGKALTEAFKDRFINVRTFRSTENDLGEDLARAENYLSLVGLVILVLGGIGVSSVTRVFVEQKLKSIAILKCVGAATRHVLGIYMTADRRARPGRQPHGRGAGRRRRRGAAGIRAGDGSDRRAD